MKIQKRKTTNRKKPTKKIIVCTPVQLGGGEKSTNKHHRRAKASGGASLVGNLSKVKISEHHAWHYFFNDHNGIPMSPEKIAFRLQILYPMIQTFFAKNDGHLKTIEEVVSWINKIWIDPDFEIILNKEGDKNF